MTVPYKNKKLLLENEITLHFMMRNNLNEDQRNKVKETPQEITPPSMIEECDNILVGEEEEKAIDTKNTDMIHRNMNENET